MADLNLSATTGLTVTAQLYLGSTASGTAIALTEIATTGEYSANMPTGKAAGTYLVVFLDSASNKLASGLIEWDGAKEVLAATRDQVPTAATTASAVRTNLATELGRIDAAISSRASSSAAGLTTAQDTRLTKLANLHGIGATLVVTETTRTAGTVSQSIVTEGYTTSVAEV